MASSKPPAWTITARSARSAAAQNARLLFPSVEERHILRLGDVQQPHDGEAIGVRLCSLDRGLVAEGIPGRGDDHRPIDPGLFHLQQQLVLGHGLLPLRRRRRAAAPDMHLGIDNSQPLGGWL
jgi:hypothetical protein